MKKIYALMFALYLVSEAMGQSEEDCVTCFPEGIEFSTQDQVDNFFINYPYCKHIAGDVAIESVNGIVNLLGLYGLHCIQGDLSIINNHNLVSLSGLNTLESIGGNLVIGRFGMWNELGNPTLKSLMGLNSLNSIGGDLIIWNNESLTSLSGLENIESGSINDLTIIGNPALAECDLQNLCNYLSNPNGVVDIYYNATGCNTTVEIAEGCGVPMPCLPYGNYYFLKQSDIDNFQTCYSGCQQLAGNVAISGNNICNLIGLSGLYAIEGTLFVTGNEILSTLSGLDSLHSIGGNVKITRNDSLTTLTGLNSLHSIGGGLRLGGSRTENTWDYTKLTSLTGLENLASIGGTFFLGNNDSLKNISGLENLTTIGGDLIIGYSFLGMEYARNPALTSLTGLENLTSIGGSLAIFLTDVLPNLTGLGNVTSIGGGLLFSGNKALTSLTGLEGVTSIWGDVSIGADWVFYGHNPSLTSLTGLKNVTLIGGELKICYNDILTNLTGLGNVTKIGYDLTIFNNDSLSSLTGLEGLNYIGGSLNIGFGAISGGNPALTNLTGLENVTSIGGNLSFVFNKLLSDCAVQSVCDYLANPNGTIEIYDNLTGCNSQQEVENACEAIGVESLTPETSLTIYPNPSSTTITLETPANGSLSIHNTSGQQLLQRQITEPNTTIDVSGWKSGVYVVKVVGEKGVQVGKFVKQ